MGNRQALDGELLSGFIQLHPREAPMAPRRKKQPPPFGREFKIRLPEDIAARIKAKAEKEQRPQNRIIINELAAFPDLEQQRTLAENVATMGDVLARYGAEIVMHRLSDALLRAVDALLKAEGGAVPAAIE